MMIMQMTTIIKIMMVFIDNDNDYRWMIIIDGDYNNT